MGENTAISWSHGTFNPFWGCSEIEGSPACGPAPGEDGPRCYARTLAERYGYVEGGANFPIWGAHEKRRFFAYKHFTELLKWNRIAGGNHEMRRIFVGSMCDWAEGRPDQAESLSWFWQMAFQTHWLNYLMLTKRPQLISKLCPFDHHPRIWQGTTAENQHWFDIRWRHLREVKSVVYWISAEPLFERIKLPADFLALGKRAWLILGGASGCGWQKADLNPDDARYMRDQCLEAGVAFHMKQMSGSTKKALGAIPPDLMIREYPEAVNS